MTAPRRAVVAGLLAALLAGPAAAAERPLWELGLGVGVLEAPHYRGADQHRTWVLPAPYVVYRGSIFRADREGARAVLVERNRFDLDISLLAAPPTSSADNRARAGMADLAPTVELGPKADWNLDRGAGWKLDLRLPLRAAFTVQARPRLVGWIAAPVLAYDRRLGDGWNLGLQAGPLLQSRRYNAYFYDVDAAHANAARPAYRAGAGYAGSQALAALSRRYERHWVGLFARYDSLRGATFGDSPLVRSDHAWSAGVAVAWVLGRSATQVPAAE